MKLTNRYAMETLHLNACLKLFWSDRYKEFYMKTCLINPSGHRGGFMPEDYFGEWVVRESQDHIPYNYTAATDEYIRRTISPQIMAFRAARKHMTAETGALTYGAHSSIVSRTTDIEVVCDNILQDQICHFKPGRAEGESDITDLYSIGLDILGIGNGITKYKKRLAKENNLRLTAMARPVAQEYNHGDDGGDSDGGGDGDSDGDGGDGGGDGGDGDSDGDSDGPSANRKDDESEEESDFDGIELEDFDLELSGDEEDQEDEGDG